MSTRIQMQSEIERLERQISTLSEQLEAMKQRATSAEITLAATLPELEHGNEDEKWHTQIARYHRNDPKREAANKVWVNLIQWAGRNLGYGDDEEEKQATGLGVLVYLRNCEPSFAVRFAAEVCEEHNYHGECARLLALYDSITQPYQNSPEQSTSVNWWAY